MSDYLINLARRSAGIATIARPRSGPSFGPIARVGRAIDGPAARSAPATKRLIADPSLSEPPARLPPAGVARVPDEAELMRAIPGLHPASEGPARARHASEPAASDRPYGLPIAERTAVGTSVHGAAMVSPPQPTTIGTDPSATSPVQSGHALDRLDADRDASLEPTPPAVDPRLDGAAARLPPPLARERTDRGTTPRLTLIEPAPAPGTVTGSWMLVEDRRPAREVQVRIGTIEIHAESPAPSAMSAPAATTPAAAAPSAGGFEAFARLRTYAPWER